MSLIEAEALGEPQRDQRLAQPVLQRLAHPQIGPSEIIAISSASRTRVRVGAADMWRV